MMVVETKTKKCSGCKRELLASEFSKNRSEKDGLNHYCRTCKRPQAKKHYIKNREKINERCREYYIEHANRMNEQSKEYRRKNRGGCREYNREYWISECGRAACRKAVRNYHTTFKGRLGRKFNGMDQRCNNPNNIKYKDYGGRGIQNKFDSPDEFRDYVVNELGITSIEQIMELQIDRIDNDGHYEKGNIRFVTCTENNNNKRRFE